MAAGPEDEVFLTKSFFMKLPSLIPDWILKYDNALSPAGSYEQRMRSARLPKLRRARLNFHHICGTTVDTEANATEQGGNFWLEF